VTLVRKESARRLGFWPVRTVQRFVKGFKGSTVFINGCHFLPLVDPLGNHQVICTYEVEEIATVAKTRLPPWSREVFPSVRAYMPLMDTEAGLVELLIGLDNTQWLPVSLEDSRNQEENMRLMKYAFGHQYMIMGGWVTAFYPKDESMRYRGDLTGESLGGTEGPQVVEPQGYQGWGQKMWNRGGGGAQCAQACWSQGQSARSRGRTAVRRP
jgi:hypothetical protein